MAQLSQIPTTFPKIVGIILLLIHFSSVQLLSCVQLFASLWTAAHQASLSISNSQSLLKLMSIELVMPLSHLLLCHPLLLLISFRINWFNLLAAQWTLKSLLQHCGSKASIL